MTWRTPRGAGTTPLGSLAIGVIPTISPYLLPRVAGPLHRKFPRLTVGWIEEKTEVLVRRLDEGRLDAALLALEADVGDLENEIVARDPFVLITPRDHPLGTRPGPATLLELAGADVLLLDEGHCFRKQALAVCNRARAKELAFRATSLPTLVQMVAAGAGVTLLPALALPTEAKRSDVRVRPFAEPAPHRTLALVWRRSSPLAPALRLIAAVIRKSYPEPRCRRRLAGAARVESVTSRHSGAGGTSRHTTFSPRYRNHPSSNSSSPVKERFQLFRLGFS